MRPIENISKHSYKVTYLHIKKIYLNNCIMHTIHTKNYITIIFLYVSCSSFRTAGFKVINFVSGISLYRTRPVGIDSTGINTLRNKKLCTWP